MLPAAAKHVVSEGVAFGVKAIGGVRIAAIFTISEALAVVVVACAGGPLELLPADGLAPPRTQYTLIEVETIGWALPAAVFATVASAAAEATPYAVLLAAAKHVVEYFGVKAIGGVSIAAVFILLLRPVANATGKGS